MLEPNVVKGAVRSYVAAIAAGDADAIASLFAEGGTAEDPVGSAIHAGRAEIREFFAGTPRPLSIDLVSVRVAGNVAAFQLSAVVEVRGARVVVEPIDVMTFDDDARIQSMRAVWNREDDVRPA